MVSTLIRASFFLSLGVFAETNLGTINTIRNNNLASLVECQKNSSSNLECYQSALPALDDILDLTTTNKCLATKVDFKDHHLNIPKCPKGDDAIKGLDNTFPSVGTFAVYMGDNTNFLVDLAKSYLSGSEVGRFNLIVPQGLITDLRNNKDLIPVLNNPRVNIIPTNFIPLVKRWMQDSFQFTSLNGKPALYQLEDQDEYGRAFERRIACQIAKECDIPYFVPPDLIDPKNLESNDLNSGGNLEVLPGGTFVNGIIKTEGYNNNLPNSYQVKKNKEYPYRTNFQKRLKDSLEKEGNKVLELDTSFLEIGHVDEFFSVVKNNKPSPCNYSIMIANPKKAFELIEEEAKKMTSRDYRTIQCSRFRNYSEISIENKGRNNVLSKKAINEIYYARCLHNMPIETFVKSEQYKALKRINLTDTDRKNISQIMEENKELLRKELQLTTKCEAPHFIDIPVFFRKGLSETPDLVNGLVESPPYGPSNVYLPRSYFKPFDEYTVNELNKVGIRTQFVHNMDYHVRQGEVHCGTNTARICKP